MAKHIAFWLVVLVTNIIQGITGFAGTILAMPPSIMLVGYNTAKPILNVLGILAGIFVFCTHGKHVNWKEFGKIVVVMTIGIFGGIGIKAILHGDMSPLYIVLGVFVIVLAVQGMWKQMKAEKREKAETMGISTSEAAGTTSGSKALTTVGNYALLLGSGVVHGIFVSGGPLLIAYLSKVIKDKVSFRATISTVWIVLNSIILVDDLRAGLWNMGLLKEQLIVLPFFLAGMFIGSKLYSKMNQSVFMKLTYVLLFISGVILLFK